MAPTARRVSDEGQVDNPWRRRLVGNRAATSAEHGIAMSEVQEKMAKEWRAFLAECWQPKACSQVTQANGQVSDPSVVEQEHPSTSEHEFPLARIKRIMKADEMIRTISHETPGLICKAVEIFITELTLRSQVFCELSGRKSLLKKDIEAAIHCSYSMDFLRELVECPDPNDQDLRFKSYGGKLEASLMDVNPMASHFSDNEKSKFVQQLHNLGDHDDVQSENPGSGSLSPDPQDMNSPTRKRVKKS